MGFKKLGDKLKNSLHHLSPKSKRCAENDEACGDLPPLEPPNQNPASNQPQAPLVKEECKINDAVCETRNDVPMSTIPPPPTAERPSTPTWSTEEAIWPSMYYKLKTAAQERVEQSVLLVNPSKSDKKFALRVSGDPSANLERNEVEIKGDFVERVTVSWKPEREESDVFVDVTHNGRLYDKIRVQAHHI